MMLMAKWWLVTEHLVPLYRPWGFPITAMPIGDVFE
jgi:hypothetical protein